MMELDDWERGTNNKARVMQIFALGGGKSILEPVITIVLAWNDS